MVFVCINKSNIPILKKYKQLSEVHCERRMKYMRQNVHLTFNRWVILEEHDNEVAPLV